MIFEYSNIGACPSGVTVTVTLQCKCKCRFSPAQTMLFNISPFYVFAKFNFTNFTFFIHKYNWFPFFKYFHFLTFVQFSYVVELSTGLKQILLNAASAKDA